MKWIFLVGLGLFLLLAAFLIFSDFADVPCQDGVWDVARKTCIPT